MKGYKKIIVILAFMLLLGGCKDGKYEEPDEQSEQVKTEAIQEDEVVEGIDMTEKVEEKEVTESVDEQKKIVPLPVTIDMNQLDNCTLAVSFEEGDAYVDDTGVMRLDATVYTYDVYDMVDISLLEEGDIILLRNQEVMIESLEKNEQGLVIINGGEENGGYDLHTNDGGVYYEIGMNDTKAYYPLGEATIRVSVDFQFYDGYDPEKGEQLFYPGDFLIKDGGIHYDFHANNTTIVIQEGQIIEMYRSYTP